MNRGVGGSLSLALPASWHNQSPTYPLSVLSIQSFYYLANSIDRRYHYILLWKMASKYMTFVTRCMLHYRAAIAWVWVLESYKSHLFFPSLPLSTNVLGCHSLCVGSPYTWNVANGLGPILRTSVYSILHSLQFGRMKLNYSCEAVNRSHQS